MQWLPTGRSTGTIPHCLKIGKQFVTLVDNWRKIRDNLLLENCLHWWTIVGNVGYIGDYYILARDFLYAGM